MLFLTSLRLIISKSLGGERTFKSIGIRLLLGACIEAYVQFVIGNSEVGHSPHLNWGITYLTDPRLPQLLFKLCLHFLNLCFRQLQCNG